MRYTYIKYTERKTFDFMTWIISTTHAIIEKCLEQEKYSAP